MTPLLLFPSLASIMLSSGLSQANPPGLSSPISYETVAVPLRKVAADWQESTKIKFEIDSDLAEEPIILRVEAAPLKTAMDEVAKVSSAEWKWADGAFHLRRSSELVARLQAQEERDREKAVSDSVSKLIESTSAVGPITQAKAEEIAQLLLRIRHRDQNTSISASDRRKARIEMAETRLLAHVLGKMDPKEIAGLSRGQRFVYSSAPTRMQRQLPTIDADALTAYVEEQNLISDSYLAAAKKKFPDGVPAEDSDRFSHIDRVPAKIRLTFDPFVSTQRILVTMEVISADGKILGRASARLGSLSEPEEIAAKRSELMLEAHKSGIQVGPDVMDLVSRYIGNSSNDAARPRLDEELQAALLSPTKHDPLSFVTSKVVLDLAKFNDLNVAFLPTDTAEGTVMFASRQGYVSLDLLELLLASDTAVIVGDRWLEGAPLMPLERDYYRTPRPVLEQYLSAFAEKGYPSIEDKEDLITAVPRANPRAALDAPVRIVWGAGSPIAFNGSDDDEGYRVLDSLTSEQKQAAANGGLTLAGGEMNQAQREQLEAFIYLSPSSNLAPAPGGKPLDQKGLDDFYNSDQERTEIFPEGLTSDATLKVQDKTEAMFVFRQSYGSGQSIPLTAPWGEMAVQIAMRQRPDLFPWVTSQPIDDVTFSLGRKVNLEVAIGKYILDESLEELHPPQGAALPLTKIVESLPDDLRQKMERRISELLDQYKKTPPGSLAAPPAQPPAPPRS